MKTLNPAVVAAAVLVMSSPLALAQSGGNGQLSSADKHYLKQDAHGAAYELQISQLAAQKANDQQVRQYAEMAVKDHENYNQQEQQLAEQNGVALPTSPTKQEQSRINRLQTLNGSAFDDAYVRDMRQVNQRDVNEERKEANSTQNPQIKQFIQEFEQMDQKHLQGAQNLPISGSNNG